jgi:uncharacterized delta-60 repeat protein
MLQRFRRKANVSKVGERLGALLSVTAVAVTAPPAYAAPGDLDQTFGSGGFVQTDIGNSSDDGGWVTALAIQSDGKIVAAGPVEDIAPVRTRRVVGVARYNPNGTLDRGFGDCADAACLKRTGWVLTDVRWNPYDGWDAPDLAIQPDGKMLVSGEDPLTNDFALARYNPNGTLDTGFGACLDPLCSRRTGMVNGGFTDAIPYGVAVKGGKIVVAGFVGGTLVSDFALARYNPNGTPDTGFGECADSACTKRTGRLRTDFGGGGDRARDVIIQGDGKIVAAGTAKSSYSSPSDFGLARYNGDGTLDATFGSAGKVMTDLAGAGDAAHALVIQTDGKLVAGGGGTARYNANGTLDMSFGNGGKISAGGTGLAIAADGKIVRSRAMREGALRRFHANGTPDASFGVGGSVDAPGWPSENEYFINDVAIQADGKIVAAGQGRLGFALARYLP